MKAKGEEGKRIRRLDSIVESMDTSLGKLQEIVRDREAWHVVVLRLTKSWTWLTD